MERATYLTAAEMEGNNFASVDSISCHGARWRLSRPFRAISGSTPRGWSCSARSETRCLRCWRKCWVGLCWSRSWGSGLPRRFGWRLLGRKQRRRRSRSTTSRKSTCPLWVNMPPTLAQAGGAPIKPSRKSMGRPLPLGVADAVRGGGGRQAMLLTTRGVDATLLATRGRWLLIGS